MNLYSRESPSRVLLQLSNPSNERLIRQNLSGDYTFVDSKSNIENSLSSVEFDLCILDTQKVRRAKDVISELKKEELPVYLPFILLVKEQNIKEYINTNLGKLYDDVLPIPISPQILESRIESLCKQRKRSLEMLKSNILANKAINTTDIGITITDSSQTDNPIVFVNEGFEELTGYNEKEVLGNNCRFLQEEDNDQLGVRKLSKAIDNGNPAEVLIRNYKKDGTLFWNALKVSPILNEKGESKYFVGIQDDVTKLIETQKDLEHLVEEKEILLQEIHHRIKNNLAVIVALLELKIMNSTSEETKTSLKETRTRIFSIAKVHELLYEHDELNKIEFRVYIKDLINHLEDVYSEISGNLDFQFKLEKLLLSLDQAVPCGMLLSELITNIYKHGFDEGDEGKVKISLTEKNGNMHILVKDNGKGLPEGKKLENTEKFSHSIINTLLQQLEAEWDANSNNGFEFKFNFELNNYAGIISDE